MSSRNPFGDVSIGGDGESITDYNDSDSVGVDGVAGWPGLTFEFSVAVSDNTITFTSRTEGVMGLGTADLVGVGDASTAKTIITPELERIQQLTSAVEGESRIPGLDIREEVQSAINRSSQFEYGSELLEPLRNISSIPMETRAEIRTPFGSVAGRGNDPEVESVSIGFRRVPVPNIQPVVDAVDQLPPMVIEGRLKPDGAIANVLGGAVGRQARAEVEVPVEAFVNFVELDANLTGLANCLQTAPDGDEIESTLNDVEQRVESIVSRSDRIGERFQGAIRRERDEIIEDIVSEFREDLGGAIDSAEEAIGDTQQQVEDITEQLPTEEELRTAIREGEDLSQFAEDPPSRTEALNSLRQGASVEEIFADEIQNIRDRRDERMDALTGSENPLRDLVKEEMPDEYLQGLDTDLANLDPRDVEGSFLPEDVADEDFLVEEVICNSRPVSDLSVREMFDVRSDGTGEITRRINEALYDVFEQELTAFEIVADEIDSLEDMVNDAYGAGEECLFIFEDIISEIRGCNSGNLMTDGGQSQSLTQAFRIVLGANIQPPEEEPELAPSPGPSPRPTPSPEPERLTCADIRQGLRSRVNDIEERAQRLEDANPFEVEFSRVEQLRSEAEEVNEIIRDEVSSRNPCKSQLQSRVKRSKSLVEQIRDVSPEDLPCVSRFSDVEDRVSQFENLAAEPAQSIRELGQGTANIQELEDEIGGGDLDIEQLVELAGENEIQIRTADLVEYVEDNAEGNCVQFFLNRLEEAEEELERAAGGFRINRDLFDAASERRQEILEEVRAQTSDPEEFEMTLEEFLERAEIQEELNQ